MKIINTRDIALSSGASEFIDLGKDAPADSVCEEVILQVKNGTLAASGKAIDSAELSNVSVSGINLATLATASSFTAGIYSIPVEALSSITLTASADTVAVVKVLA